MEKVIPHAEAGSSVISESKARPLRLFNPREWLWLGILVLAVFGLRAALFVAIEPRIDQAYFASIIRDEVQASHLIPQGPGGFLQRLEKDEKSFLNAVGKPMYSSPQRMFYTVPMLLLWLALIVPGYSYTHLVLLSIFASCVTLIPLTILLRISGVSRGWSFTAALLYSTSAYASLYSPLGPHNFGVPAAVSAVTIATFLLFRETQWGIAATGLLSLVTAAAMYTHFINPLLVPAPIAFALLMAPRCSLRERARLAGTYLAVTCLFLVPVGLVTLYLHQIQNSFLVFANVDHSAGEYLKTMPARAAQWFILGSQLFSIPGVILGVTGCVWLARSTGLYIPAVFLAVHFACYCVLPGFINNGSNTYLRTYNYALPFLALGASWLLWKAFRIVKTGGPLWLGFAIFAGLVWHLAMQAPFGGYEKWARRNAPDFADDYLTGQGQLRPVVKDIERKVAQSPLTFWGFPERFVYTSLADNTSSVTPWVLGSLASRSADGALRDAATLQAAATFRDGYILIADDTQKAPSAEQLSSVLAQINESPSERIDLVRIYTDSVGVYGTFSLFHVSRQ